MQDLIQLWRVVAEEFGSGCSVTTIRDQNLVSERSKTEGDEFLTITLPDFGKEFDRALSLRRVDKEAFPGFARLGALPIFLGGFLDHVFDRQAGVLLEAPCGDCILAVRQLTGIFGKVELECSTERTNRAYQEYLECEQELTARESEWTQEDYLEFSRVARLVFGRVLSRMDDLVRSYKLVPKHGPGATADRLSGNRKYDLRMWTVRLEGVCPSSDFLIPSHRHYRRLEAVELLEPGDELPVRVIHVPKTMKTPRIIAVEPTCMQYVQQAVSEPLVDLINRDKITSRFISFNDQTPNQRMARQGSRDGSLATLDLSEASDRVSVQLVEWLLRGFTDLHDVVMASRSLRADVRGKIIDLTKFASMGSALTFPIEAMVFLTIVFVGIEKRLGHKLSVKDLKRFSTEVRVYGDDIIVPTDYADAVAEALERFHFKVNARKSFSEGNFRESCGKEYFAGRDVSIVKVRRLFPTDRTDVPAVISLVELRNLFYKRGLIATSEYLDDLIRGVLRYFPDGREESAGLVRVVDGPISFERWDPYKHIGQVKAYVPEYKYKRVVLDDLGALMKFFLRRGAEPFADVKHLERSGRPVAVSIKPRWVDPQPKG